MVILLLKLVAMESFYNMVILFYYLAWKKVKLTMLSRY